jgi:hypothetical protein
MTIYYLRNYIIDSFLRTWERIGRRPFSEKYIEGIEEYFNINNIMKQINSDIERTTGRIPSRIMERYHLIRLRTIIEEFAFLLNERTKNESVTPNDINATKIELKKSKACDAYPC